MPDGSTQFEFKCTSGGAWSPDPDDYHCVQGMYIYVPYDIQLFVYMHNSIINNYNVHTPTVNVV